MQTSGGSKIDVLIIGGGLAGGLTALKLKAARPEAKIVVLESGEAMVSGRTFSFHESDVSADALELLRPLIARSWNQTSVRFPRFTRTFDGAYHSFRSENLQSAVKAALGEDLRLGVKLLRATASEVVLAGGELLSAELVLDARGASGPATARINGFQKFIGLDMKLEEPHGLSAPLIMDATCPQLDGFRFFYLLPLDGRRLLIEETYYSDGPELNHERITRSIKSYAERHGWKIEKIEREESGVLPIPMTSDAILASASGEPLPIGTRGGYYHATTGYSLPEAMRIADYLGSLAAPTTDTAREGLMRFRRGFLSRQRFYRMLNRMLFCASEPSLRYQVMQHFYEQPQDVIERFYAGRTTWTDRLRILSGRPPIPIERALRSLSERTVLARSSQTQPPPAQPQGGRVE